jgi:GDP-4-dehydro-6-deoxy-D-mannose reductase
LPAQDREKKKRVINMKKCLIIGVGGFIGSHLADFLLKKNFTISGTVHRNTKNIDHLKDAISILECDIRDKSRLEMIIKEIKPDYIFYLATQNFIAPSWEDPENTINTNILGTIHLLEAIRKTGTDPVIEVISSSAVYGMNFTNEIPIKEDKEFRPLSPYAVSKIGVDMLAYLYWQTYNMKIIRIRPFNITGPRRTSDVCSDFAKGIAEIEAGRKQVLEVGNLESIRDITDIKDAVHAMWLLSHKGHFGEAYNLCSGKGYKIKDILEKLISLSESDTINICQNPSKIRKMDDPLQIGDNSKLKRIGWTPEIPIDQTLTDLLSYWRDNTGNS